MASHGRSREHSRHQWSFVVGIFTAVPERGIRLPIFVWGVQKNRAFSVLEYRQGPCLDGAPWDTSCVLRLAKGIRGRHSSQRAQSMIPAGVRFEDLLP